MKLDELPNAVIVCVVSPRGGAVNRTGYYTPKVLFVPFVV